MCLGWGAGLLPGFGLCCHDESYSADDQGSIGRLSLAALEYHPIMLSWRAGQWCTQWDFWNNYPTVMRTQAKTPFIALSAYLHFNKMDHGGILVSLVSPFTCILAWILKELAIFSPGLVQLKAVSALGIAFWGLSTHISSVVLQGPSLRVRFPFNWWALEQKTSSCHRARRRIIHFPMQQLLISYWCFVYTSQAMSSLTAQLISP